MNLNQLSKEIHKANVEKGFYEDNEEAIKFLMENNASDEVIFTVEKAITGQRLALITSEVSEALESDRKNKKANIIAFLNERRSSLHESDNDFKISFEKNIKDSVEDEISDAIIRLLDFCGYKGIDIHFHINEKLRFNSLRPHKHGKTY